MCFEHQPPRGRQHVGPVDPVIQGVEPELRLLLGLLTQLPSQFGDFRRQRDPGLHLRQDRRLVLGRRRAASFRSGTFVQADLLTSDGKHESGRGPSLRGQLPRFVATMSPSDSRPGRATVMDSRRPLIRRHARAPTTRPGLSGSSIDLSAPAVPYSPRRSPTAASARCFAAGVRLHPIWEAGHSHLCNEAETGSRFRITADAFAFPGSDGGSPAPPLGRLHGERAIPMVSTFQLTRSTRLA